MQFVLIVSLIREMGSQDLTYSMYCFTDMAAARSLWHPSILPMLNRAKSRKTMRPFRSFLDSKIDNTYIVASLNIKEAMNEYYL